VAVLLLVNTSNPSSESSILMGSESHLSLGSFCSSKMGSESHGDLIETSSKRMVPQGFRGIVTRVQEAWVDQVVSCNKLG